ncbi:MAG: hypothetical protein JJE21_08805 [Spirochaetaceae bacterium]|nr:hypothetical protein [Spirochaetaceae bacterium]
MERGNTNGGVVIIGSHVKKTTEQLELLKTDRSLKFVEFNQHLVLTDDLDKEVDRVDGILEDSILKSISVVVYTNRERVDFPSDDKEKNLSLRVKISDALTSIVSNLESRPSFIVAKGGITSSDIGTKALQVKKAIVLGQIEKGIPVWNTGFDSKFPNLPYVIFPGNVGDSDTLLKVVRKVIDQKEY